MKPVTQISLTPAQLALLCLAATVKREYWQKVKSGEATAAELDLARRQGAMAISQRAADLGVHPSQAVIYPVFLACYIASEHDPRQPDPMVQHLLRPVSLRIGTTVVNVLMAVPVYAGQPDHMTADITVDPEAIKQSISLAAAEHSAGDVCRRFFAKVIPAGNRLNWETAIGSTRSARLHMRLTDGEWQVEVEPITP